MTQPDILTDWATLTLVLQELIDHTHNCERELTEDLHHVDFCGESKPLTDARTVLASISALTTQLSETQSRSDDYYERWNDCQDKRMAAEAEVAELRAEIQKLSDPVAVHANMLRGTIALPSLEHLMHLYGINNPTSNSQETP